MKHTDLIYKKPAYDDRGPGGQAAARNIVFIGDSLTQWFDWGKRFEDDEVANLGIAGEPVEGLLDRREVLYAHIRNQPDYIFLMTGINNILSGQYTIDAPYREIVRNLTGRYKRSRVVVQSLLPVSCPGISNAVIADVNRRLEQIALEGNAGYLDVYSAFINEEGDPGSEYLQDDGIHLTSKGYAAWAREVERYLSAG